MKLTPVISDSYIPAIDGLRAVAVLSVLLFHLDPALLPGGFTGVDVFFVISGYVISKSLATLDLPKFSIYILGFYRRRILRIAPALLFFLVVTSIFNSLFIPDAWLSASNKWTSIWAFFGVSNVYLVNGADGYFSNRISFNPFVHTWSLAVEEQFYLIFPFVFYAWLKVRGAKGSSRIWVIWLLPVIALLSFIFAAYETEAHQVRAFYLLPSRFWELAAGALLFQYQSSRVETPGPVRQNQLWSLCGVAAIAFGFVYADKQAFPFPWALSPVIGTIILLSTSTQAQGNLRVTQMLLESRVLNYMGRISYSLYLWHWGVFTLFHWTVGLTGAWKTALAIILTFGLSSFSYHAIEIPIRRSAYLRKLSGQRILIFGLGTVASTALAIGLLFQYGGAWGLKPSVTANGYDWSPYYPVAASELAPNEVAEKIGKGKTVFVIGDSHAGAYTNMVKLTTAKLGANAKMLGRDGCPLANLRNTASTTEVCRDFEKSILNLLKTQARPGDIVFLASLRVPRLSDQWGIIKQSETGLHQSNPAEIAERELALKEAKELIKKLQQMGLKVLMDAPKPLFRSPPFRCSDWFNKSNPVCAAGFEIDRVTLLQHREPTMIYLRHLQQTVDLILWDPFLSLCGSPVCSAFDGEIPIFSDGDHLSGYGGRMLVKSFSAKLEEVWRAGHR